MFILSQNVSHLLREEKSLGKRVQIKYENLFMYISVLLICLQWSDRNIRRGGGSDKRCNIPRGHRSSQSLLDYPAPSAEL